MEKEPPTEAEPTPEPMDTNAVSDTNDTTEDIDVSFLKDGGILKTITTFSPVGAKGPPPTGSKVTAHYTGTLKSDGSKFDSSVDRGDPFKFTIGQGQVIKGWDQGFASMKIGEKATLNIRSDYGYGKSGSPPKIPGDADLVFEVELIDFEEEDDFEDGEEDSDYGSDGGGGKKQKWNMSAEEKLEKAKELKAEATELFTNKDFQSAAVTYVDAAGYIKDKHDDDQLTDEHKTLFTSCWSNAAMCYLKAGQNADVIKACDNVLELGDKNLKCLYRRGVAKMNVEDYTEAKKDLMAALEVDKGSTAVRQALSKLKGAVKAAKKKERDMFGGCFDKVSLYAEKNDKKNKAKKVDKEDDPLAEDPPVEELDEEGDAQEDMDVDSKVEEDIEVSDV